MSLSIHGASRQDVAVGNSVQIQVRTSKKNREWLKSQAQQEDRSVNWIINKMLDTARIAGSYRQPG
jgi:predicted HicB family RNase H-like nuclease